jgi:serine/threonine protein kinase
MEEIQNLDSTNAILVFKSTSTFVFKTINLKTQKEVLVKLPTSKLVQAPTIENYRKEFQYGKILHDRFPDSFVDFHELHETENSVAIIQNPEVESLETLLSKKQKFGPKKFLELAIDMCNSLIHLHSMNMIHLDVKPSNFLLTKEKKTKLIDFGLTVMVSKKNPSFTVNHPTGTFLYMRFEK